MAIRIECGYAERNEIEALDRLAADLPDDWALFTNIPRHITGEGVRGREIDALAVSPRGAVVVELKHYGGEIVVSPLGEWIIRGTTAIDRKGVVLYPLQQAGKAAQMLKSALGAKARSVYIEACAVATGRGATIRFGDPSRPQAVATLDGAPALIASKAAQTRGVAFPVLQAIFDLVGRPVPERLAQDWRPPAPLPPPPPPVPPAPPRSPPASPRATIPLEIRPEPTRPREAAGMPIGALLSIGFAILVAIYLASLTFRGRAPSITRLGDNAYLNDTASGAGTPSSGATVSPGSRIVALDTRRATDVWSTSVYSYAPGGGGPGGGLANEYLRVGGYGDEYVSLIKFNLPGGGCRSRAELQLYALPDEGSPTAMRLYEITEPWDLGADNKVWWRDLPVTAREDSYELVAPAGVGWYSVDLTDMYRRWCDNSRPNNGFMLRPSSTNNSFNRFGSTRAVATRRPRLILTP